MEYKRKVIIDTALEQLGKPYKWGGLGPDSFDCEGLVVFAYKAAGLKILQGSKNQFAICVPTDNPLPGDLGFFGNDKEGIYHVGIVADDSTVVEARALDKNAKFATGQVIKRPLIVWKNYVFFKGWRSHPSLTGV